MSYAFRLSSIGIIVIFLCITAAPAYAADNDKPLIFTNTGSYIGFFGGENFGMVRFGELAREKGFRIDHGVQPNLAIGSPLEGIDVYILFDPNFPFTDADKIALRQWVRNGGILITSSWYASSDKVGGFVREFGVEFGPYAITNRSIFFTPNSPLSKPLTVSSMTTKAGRYIVITDPTRSEPILRYENGTIAATRTISHAGNGEIITYTCLATLYDNNINGDIGNADNEDLVSNLLTYIKNKIDNSSTQEGYDLKLLKPKFKRGTTFVPGEEIKFIAKIRNIGTVLSGETRVAFYIERIGNAPSAVIEVTSATVPEIIAGKKIKLVKKTFLPEDLDAGTYKVTAVVDPDELTSDTNTGNNSAEAKKKIIIE